VNPASKGHVRGQVSPNGSLQDACRDSTARRRELATKKLGLSEQLSGLGCADSPSTRSTPGTPSTPSIATQRPSPHEQVAPRQNYLKRSPNKSSISRPPVVIFSFAPLSSLKAVGGILCNFSSRVSVFTKSSSFLPRKVSSGWD
jgi:hypothetical protein